jgi:hypothetical protein
MKRHAFKGNRNRILTGILFAAFIGFGCSGEMDLKIGNQPPTVWLSGAPPEGSKTKYTIQLFWGGWDLDGEIRYYEFTITDNDFGFFDPADTTGADKWHKVYANDSTFTFTADQVADSSDIGGTMQPIEFIRTHTFFIRAVDEQGLASVEPAYRSFTAWTLSPEIDILIPLYNGLSPVVRPPVSRFMWIAKDDVNNARNSQEPEFVRWILVPRMKDDLDWHKTLQYIQQNPDAHEWSVWLDYQAPDESGKSWTTPPLEFGAYMFAVQAKDEAGAVTPVFDERRNVRKIQIAKRPIGPLLKVNNDYLGTFISNTATTAFSLMDIPARIPLEFEWTASAASYGGVVAGYRYGWDVWDINNPNQWAVDWTPFTGKWASSYPKTWWFGTHIFRVEVIDNSGLLSRVNVKINIIPLTMEKNLLVVDDFYEDPTTSGWANTNGALPSDEEHDAFWAGALDNVEEFDPQIDMIEVSRNNPLGIETLVSYKNIIWDVYGGYNLRGDIYPFLHDMIRFIPKEHGYTVIGKIQPNLLALFMAAGGHVLICGHQPMTMVMIMDRKSFPFIFQYELFGDQDGEYEDQVDNPVGDHSFACRDMCLDVLDIATTSWDALRQPGADGNGCGVTQIRTVDARGDGLRRCVPMDMNFPPLELRDEAAGTGRAYAEDKRGLNDELYNPPYFRCGPLDLGPRDCFQPIYGHGCLNTNSAIYNAPNAAWSSAFAHVFPDVDAGVAVAARSAVWGFEPVYMDTVQVREALEYILFQEWQLPRR